MTRFVFRRQLIKINSTYIFIAMLTAMPTKVYHLVSDCRTKVSHNRYVVGIHKHRDRSQIKMNTKKCASLPFIFWINKTMIQFTYGMISIKFPKQLIAAFIFLSSHIYFRSLPSHPHPHLSNALPLLLAIL